MPHRLIGAIAIAALTAAPVTTSAQTGERSPAVECACPCKPCGDGVEYIRHPHTGKLIVLRTGELSTHYHYNAAGLLNDAETSDGLRVVLGYNAKQQIERMEVAQAQAPQQRALSFRYGKQGKPVYIALHGVGAITVRYDAQGEIESVQSPQGARMALGVTQAFQALQSIIHPPCHAD